ncbi:hypothetical protein AAMO2058_001715100 [Amorphochlora amoebiformis]
MMVVWLAFLALGAASEPTCDESTGECKLKTDEYYLPIYRPAPGTKRLAESATIVVWELEIAPNERLAAHEHYYDATIHTLNGSWLAAYSAASGEHMFSFEVPEGSTIMMERKGQEMHFTDPDFKEFPPFEASYAFENVGSTSYRALVYERKPDPCAGLTLDQAPTVRLILLSFEESISGSERTHAVERLYSPASEFVDLALTGESSNREEEKGLTQGHSHALLLSFDSGQSRTNAMSSEAFLTERNKLKKDLRFDPLEVDFHPTIIKASQLPTGTKPFYRIQHRASTEPIAS